MKLHTRLRRLTVLSAAIGVLAAWLSGCGGGSGSSGSSVAAVTVSGSSGTIAATQVTGAIPTGANPAPTMQSASGLTTASAGGTFTVNVTAPASADTLLVGTQGQSVYYSASLAQKSVALAASHTVPTTTRQAGNVFSVTFAIGSAATSSTVTFEAVYGTAGVYSLPATLQVSIVAANTGGNGNPPSSPDLTRSACAANPVKSGVPKWTVLVYVNAANNLSSFSFQNISQMMQVGSDSNVNIVVQWKLGTCSDCGTYPNAFVSTRRYLIKPHSAADVSAVNGGDTTSLAADQVADLGSNVDMGSYQTLQQFVQWGASTYPASNLALVIWDHGSASLPINRTAKRKGATRAVSFDDVYNDEIETQELPLALASPPQPIDLLIFDCSLEQTIEVEYQVRNNARLMVAGEDSPPGSGYPYNLWLADLKSNGANPCNVGADIVNEFVNNTAYAGYSDITQSVIDLSQMNNVAAAAATFTNSLIQHTSDQASMIASARNNVTTYAESDGYNQIDFWGFADAIRRTATTSDLVNSAAAFEKTLIGSSGAVLMSRYGSGGDSGSNGIAVYLPPPSNYDSEYTSTYEGQSLTWTTATQWAAFIQDQTQ